VTVALIKRLVVERIHAHTAGTAIDAGGAQNRKIFP
jgi:hypothetical protein